MNDNNTCSNKESDKDFTSKDKVSSSVNNEKNTNNTFSNSVSNGDANSNSRNQVFFKSSGMNIINSLNKFLNLNNNISDSLVSSMIDSNQENFSTLGNKEKNPKIMTLDKTLQKLCSIGLPPKKKSNSNSNFSKTDVSQLNFFNKSKELENSIK